MWIYTGKRLFLFESDLSLGSANNWLCAVASGRGEQTSRSPAGKFPSPLQIVVNHVRCQDGHPTVPIGPLRRNAISVSGKNGRWRRGQGVSLNFHARKCLSKTKEQSAWQNVDSSASSRKGPPTAGGKPVSFGLAAPGGGRLNSNGADSFHKALAARQELHFLPVADFLTGRAVDRRSDAVEDDDRTLCIHQDRPTSSSLSCSPEGRIRVISRRLYR